MRKSNNGSLDFVHIGDYRIMEPSIPASKEIESKGEQHLRANYPAGTYAGRTDGNAILKSMFEFHDSLLESLLPKIATCWWIGSIIFQYEETGKISNAYKLGKLPQDEAIYWRKHGPVLRQALDFLLEKLCVLKDIDVVEESMSSQISSYERALACAKKCVEYTNVSNLTHMVFGDQTNIKISTVGKRPFLEHVLPDEVHRAMINYQIQNNKEVLLRPKYMDHTSDPFDLKFHIQCLDKPFQDEFNLTYTQFQAIVFLVIESIEDLKYPGHAPMSLKTNLLAGISEELEAPLKDVERVMQTLILDSSIPREVWDSRQYNRLTKRPFLEFKSKGRIVLMYSRNKLSEYLALLDMDLAFNKVREDWDVPGLRKAIGEISNNTGTWFERSVIPQLEKLGFVGRAINNNTFNRFKEINFDCGQIDYLAYHPEKKCLAIFEFKMFDTGFDARGIRQVRGYFLDGKKSFVNIFGKKIEWVKSNLTFVKSYFMNEFNAEIPDSISTVNATFITYYPTLMKLFYSEIPCRSLVQFVDDCNENGIWPYQ